MSGRPENGVLGLFPSFSEVGGVERSGLEAWRAIAGASGGENHLIRYGLARPANASGLADEFGGTVYEARSQVAALLLAASRGWPVELVVVWHIGMLKLLPFIRTSGSRTVLFLHGIEAWRKASPVTARLLRRVDLFLTNSDFTWEKFMEYHPELSSARHCTVPLGLGDPVDSVLIDRPAAPPMALMIGRAAKTEAYKGHDSVIDAWPAVRERIPGARLRLIGPSEMTDELMENARKRGVGDVVEIVGPVSEDAKWRALAECRCMALPSRGEGFGLAYIESMRMGRPCVVSTLDAGREVVCPEDGSPAGGLAADPADSGSLAAALIRLMTPGPEWEQWSLAASRRYATQYTGELFRKRLIAALIGAAC